HLTTNTVLDILADKNEATAVSYLTILQADAERGLSLQPIAVGRYHDTFKRVDGKWEFSVRELIKIGRASCRERVYSAGETEDGIRDFHVTGVQTCALPICT